MSLTLVIETSYKPFTVALGDRSELFYSSSNFSNQHNTDIGQLIQNGLHAIDKSTLDIKLIVVSIGPGGLTSVRSGVTFCNSLAFGLGIPVCAINSFELIGFELWSNFKKPVLCSARATEGKAYVGMYNDNALVYLNYGYIDKLVLESCSSLDEVIVSGTHREQILNMNIVITHDSNKLTGKAETFFKMHYPVDMKKVAFSQINPPDKRTKPRDNQILR